MVAVLAVGTIIGLIWADTSDVAGTISVGTNIVGLVGIVVLLIASSWRPASTANGSTSAHQVGPAVN